jgi:hypothetical protein
VSCIHPLIGDTFLFKLGIFPFKLKVPLVACVPFQSSLRPSKESNPYIILSFIKFDKKLIDFPLWTPNSKYKPSSLISKAFKIANIFILSSFKKIDFEKYFLKRLYDSSKFSL